jgi:hypothetical protein
MFSKMMKPKDDISEYDLLKTDPRSLDKFKLPELKLAAKYFGLRVSGNKTELKTRIIENLEKCRKIVKIQKTFRGHLARLWIKLKKGTGAPSVNDTDFCTLEPIEEMEFIYYIHYTDVTEHASTSYVFNINSLINLAMNNKKLENPYTRKDIKKILGTNLIKVINLTYILFPENDLMKNSVNIINEMDNNPNINQLQIQLQLPAIPIDLSANYQHKANELFMKIDALGNYTNVAWFNALTNNQLCTLILRIYNFWGFIDRNLKVRICPHKSPFSIDNLGIETVSTARPIEDNRAIAIRVGETLVYDGGTDEYRTLGAMYFITGMTLVCEEAREQMPWLYDNYFAVTRRN